MDGNSRLNHWLTMSRRRHILWGWTANKMGGVCPVYGLREFPMWNNTLLEEHVTLRFWQSPMNPRPPWSWDVLHGERMWHKDGPSALHGAVQLIPKHHQIPRGTWPLDTPSYNGSLCKSLLTRELPTYHARKCFINANLGNPALSPFRNELEFPEIRTWM